MSRRAASSSSSSSSSSAADGAAAAGVPSTMSALRYSRYGRPADVLKVKSGLSVPRVKKPDDVLVRVKAVALARGDCHLVNGTPYLIRMMFGVVKPTSIDPGLDFAGEVVAVGSSVSDVAVGDRVMGAAEPGGGAMADFLVQPAEKLVRMPAALSFAEAAAVPVSGATAVNAVVKHGGVSSGDSVLVVGAAGGVGHFAVQVAKERGATVTAVCSAAGAALASACGADTVVDYRTADAFATGNYDVIIDCVGDRPLADCRAALAPGGTYVAVARKSGKWIGPITAMAAVARASEGEGDGKKTMKNMLSMISPEVLADLAERVQAGTLRPHVTQTFRGLDQAAQAYQAVDDHGVSGKCVVLLADDAENKGADHDATADTARHGGKEEEEVGDAGAGASTSG